MKGVNSSLTGIDVAHFALIQNKQYTAAEADKREYLGM